MTDFISTAASRETSPEIMEAILAVAVGNEAEAAKIWDEPSQEQMLAVWERVTKNGLYESTDYCWGAAGSNWADIFMLDGPIRANYFLCDANSIERAAELVSGGTTDCCSNFLAGQYAFEAAVDGDEDDLSDNAFACHLEFLRDAGAEFDEKTAIKFANAFKAQYLADREDDEAEGDDE